MAIATEKALSAYRRAIAYQCTSFTGKTGPGEHVVPAVRTPDGSLIYFVDERDQRSLLEDDFGLTAPADRGHGIHLTAIDHIALALPGGQQDTWVLFYRAVLGLEPMDTVVLSDPNGLVRSRSMVDKDRKVRLPLNFTSARETSTARSIATQFGSGVHHIAFECSDLFAFADQLAESNAPVLPIPDNYYGDLIARFDLAPDYVDKLQSRNMLYDRIGTGTFLHIYTESFDDRFFLEFVQRIGGYQDYGAANAAVRMAAHARLARHRQP
jgi:4-hydroxyphenylpyruvate dioxygenase